MTPPDLAVDRRTLLKGAGLGAVAALVPLRAFDAQAAAAPSYDGVFGYGVASGDPTGTAVVIWTRATERVQADYYLTPRPTTAVPDPRLVPSLEPALAVSWQTRVGSRHVTRAAAPIGQRWDRPRGWVGPAGRPRS